MKSARTLMPVAVAALLFTAGWTYANTARDFFNHGAERFTKEDNEQALKWVNDGLAQYPDDPPLIQLKHLLEQRQQQQSQNQKNQDQQQQNQQQQQQEDKDQQQQDEQSKAAQAQQAEQKQGDEDKEKPAQEMTKEEAVLLLDAMKEQEQALREKIALDRIRSSMGRLPPVEKDW